MPLEKEDKFLIEPFDPSIIPVKWTESQITQAYLVSPEPERNGGSGLGATARASRTSTRSSGMSAPASAPKRRKSILSESEHRALLWLSDPKRAVIVKRRICFFSHEQFFEVDLFESPQKGLALMEAERTDLTPVLEMPPFIKVIRKVTGDKRYSNAGDLKARGSRCLMPDRSTGRKETSGLFHTRMPYNRRMPTSADLPFESAYKRLNMAQKDAVDSIDGPVMVIAGPGTGKTTILTLRIANILKQTDTPPHGILAITYTDAGVKAMRQKLRDIIGNRAHEVAIHTFHSFASAMIAEYQDHFLHLEGLRHMNEVEQESLIRAIIVQPDILLGHQTDRQT